MKNSNAKKNDVSYDIKVTRAVAFKNGGAGFEMEVNGVKIYNCTVIEGKKGDFVSFPQRKGNDGKYYSYAYFPMDEDMQADIIAQVEKLLD